MILVYFTFWLFVITFCKFSSYLDSHLYFSVLKCPRTLESQPQLMFWFTSAKAPSGSRSEPDHNIIDYFNLLFKRDRFFRSKTSMPWSLTFWTLDPELKILNLVLIFSSPKVILEFLDRLQFFDIFCQFGDWRDEICARCKFDREKFWESHVGSMPSRSLHFTAHL